MDIRKRRKYKKDSGKEWWIQTEESIKRVSERFSLCLKGEKKDNMMR